MAIDINLIKGAADANKAQAPLTAEYARKITNTVVSGAQKMFEGVQQREALFDDKIEELRAQDGLGSEFFKSEFVSEKLEEQRRKYIMSSPAKRASIMAELDRDNTQLQKADALAKIVVEDYSSGEYSKSWTTSEDGAAILQVLKEGPKKQEDGTFKYKIGDELKTADQVGEILESKKVDKVAKDFMTTSLVTVNEEAKKDKGGDKPFDDFKYEGQVSNIVDSSNNIESLLTDNIIGGTSLLDDLKEKVGKMKYEELGLNPVDFDIDEPDGVIDKGELEKLNEWFLNPENEEAAREAIKDYFMLYLRSTYNNQRKIFGRSQITETIKRDDQGNVISFESKQETTKYANDPMGKADAEINDNNGLQQVSDTLSLFRIR